jgi:two-component system nitrogen regulation response regulator NtrX
MSRILVVDDEASVRRSIRKLLERVGFEIAEAASGKTALDMIATDSAIEAVVSDVLMPEIDGVDFYDRLVALMPHLQRKVIFLTGAAQDTAVLTPLEQRGVPLLHKLDDPQLLVDAVRLALLKRA